MTTLPPAPLPAPVPAPAGPPKKPSSGVTALVFGIILCFIGFVYAGPRVILTIMALIIQPDAYVFGQFIGTLLFVAAAGIPGILLIRRFTRIRRAKREAIAAAIWELEYDAEHDDDDVPPAAPSATQAPSVAQVPPAGQVPPTAASTAYAPAAPATGSAPPVPPAPPAAQATQAAPPAPPIPPVPPMTPPA